MTRSTQVRAWAKAIAYPAKEFGLTPLLVLSGAIPPGLRGSLYRNGSARLERGGQRVGHWFDGDGAVLGVHFTNTGASGIYRYVQTAEYKAEEKAGKLIFESYGTMPPRAVWEQFGKSPKNPANTSVIVLPDKVLALWEGGQPYALDLQTLDTIGLDTLGGLKNDLPYSAHPKRDPKTGDIYNFGVTYGKNGMLHIYRSDSTGQIQQQAAIALDGLPLIHDFVLTSKYLVFFIPPVRLNPLPLLTKLKSFSDSLSWQPNKGTQILVIDRDTLGVVSRGEAEPWFQWLFGNGYVDTDGCVVVDTVCYKNFQTNQYLKEVVTGQTQTTAKGTLWKIRLNPQSGKVIEMEEVLKRICDFPTVASNEIGQLSRFTYLLLHRLETDISQERFGAIGRFDHQTRILTEADIGNNRYPVEPIYAPDAKIPGQGWILTVVFDGDHNSSEVWIFDANHLDAAPVCMLALPSVVPLGFHGTWKPAYPNSV